MQSIQNLLARNRGRSLSANRIRRLSYDEVDRLLPEADLALAVKGNIAVMRTLSERTVSRPNPDVWQVGGNRETQGKGSGKRVLSGFRVVAGISKASRKRLTSACRSSLP